VYKLRCEELLIKNADVADDDDDDDDDDDAYTHKNDQVSNC